MANAGDRGGLLLGTGREAVEGRAVDQSRNRGQNKYKYKTSTKKLYHKPAILARVCACQKCRLKGGGLLLSWVWGEEVLIDARAQA